MIYVYKKTPDLLVKKTQIDDIKKFQISSDILWIDLLLPSKEEVNFITKNFGVEFPDDEERKEIELSAKFWEDNESITINAHFLDINFTKSHIFQTKFEIVTIIANKNILFTIRDSDFKVFNIIQARVLASPRNFEDGYDIIDKIFEVRVEKNADLLEMIDKKTRKLRIEILEDKNQDYDEILKRISMLQDINMNIRDSLFDKRRSMTSLIRSEKIDSEVKNNLTIALKDLNSLIDFSISQFNILDNMQTILANQVNIEQNKIIKLFTVVTVAMMPPTLIASIYGMNFKYMPELESHYGYPVALILMILSTIAPIAFFKKKGWL